MSNSPAPGEARMLPADELRDERARLGARVSGLESSLDGVCKDRDNYANERNQLREALRKYGQHINGCRAEWARSGCDCGFDELMETL